ncbi:FACT complex subunit [Marasmius tenuissimus]|uniref:FACT complex subunit n=1 Tax=Marasmius tenuissimus TaxID=585030 RepID=A0ABR2ZAE3_9AGAR
MGNEQWKDTFDSFAPEIITRNGTNLAFTKVNKDGHEPTESYFKKKIRLKNKMSAGAKLLAVAFADDDDEDDGDMINISSGSNRPVNSSHVGQ